MPTITAADILTAARNCTWSPATLAWRVVNNAGDGFDAVGEHFGSLVGVQDGISVYDDNGDAVVVGDEWACRISEDEPLVVPAD